MSAVVFAEGKSGAIVFSGDAVRVDDAAAAAAAASAADSAASAAQAAAEVALVNTIAVADTTALAALDEAQWLAAITADGTQWLFTDGDFSAEITALDPRYVGPDSDPTGATGAWVRAGAVVDNWQPIEWGSSSGSLWNGSGAAKRVRTGGFGTYGMDLLQLVVTAATPAGQFDSGRTAWVTNKNLTGGGVLGGWTGANSPAAALGDTYSSGYVNGMEINAGNRWGDLGLLADTLGAGRAIVGLKLVPDVVPSPHDIDGPAYIDVEGITISTPGVVTITGHGFSNGQQIALYKLTGTLPGGLADNTLYYVVSATANTFQLAATVGGAAIATTGTFAVGVAVIPSYPASFALSVGKSNWGHRWWTGLFTRQNSIMPGGYAARLRGGDSAANSPAAGLRIDGYHTVGMDLSDLLGATTGLLLPAISRIGWGGSYMLGTASVVAITTGAGTGEGRLSANADTNIALRWASSGAAPQIGFYNTTPVSKQTVAAAGTDPATTQALANSLRTLGINLGLWSA